ncbi:MAG: phospholipase A [Bdellovibrionales bacterium]|nr:phospholipase A [Bdellovibrionales bacterium]
MIFSYLMVLLYGMQTFGQPALGNKPVPEVQQDGAPQLTAVEKKTEKMIDKLEADDSLMVEKHKTMYFAFGDPISKVQLSFKTYIVRDVPVFFGYSQIIFWNLQEESKPFFDATYNPELFYRLKLKGSWISHFDFGVWEHNSNGKGKDASRSYDQTYMSIQMERPYERWQLNFKAKLAMRYNIDETNIDITEYLGPVEITLTALQLFQGWVDRGEFSVRMYPGGRYAERWDRGGFEVGYSFRLGGVFIRPALYVQYMNGYAESLLNYNTRVQVVRGGISF